MTDYSHDIEKYLKGELTPAERHALEKKALNDPFLADALEGAEQIKSADFSKDVAQLNERISGKKAVTVWQWTARIAAGLAFILVTTFIVWSVMETEPPQELAMEKNEEAATPPPTSDSTTSETETLSSPPVEQPAAGPAIRDKDLAKQSPPPIKIETKPQNKTGEALAKNEPVTEAIASTKTEDKTKAEEKAVAEKVDELKVTEPLAQKEVENITRAKAEDDQESRAKAITRGAEVTKKKAAVADSKAPVSVAPNSYGYIKSPKVIIGKITSAEDGTVIPGVNVLIKGTSTGTVTDEEGNYQIEVDDTNTTLVYSFIGLQAKEVATNNRDQINVSMTSDVAQLSEVVVVGYGTQSADERVPPTVDMTHPETGNRSFKQYLERNIRYPEQARINKVEGRVTVQFTVETDGTLTNFTVLRGIGSGCDEELIRLIKEGPRWVPTKKDNISVQDKAKVRLKFEVPR